MTAFKTLQLPTDHPQETLVIKAEVWRVIAQFQQHAPDAAEAGGMLFATIEPGWIAVQHATIPHAKDKRTRHRFEPNLAQQQLEVKRQFKQGLHFVGEWHTHPEPRPEPSQTDLQSMARCFSSSRHSLKAFVMLIAGTDPWPKCLWVSLHRQREAICLLRYK